MRKCSARCYYSRSSSVRERQRADAKERTSAVRGRARGFGGKPRKRPLDLYMNSCRATRSGERNVFGNILQENGDVILVTPCGIYLWGFRSDKKVVQLLIRMLLQRFCTVSTKTYYVFHSDTVLCRIASRRFVKNWFCEGLRRLAAKLRRFKSVAGRRIALSHRKNEI